MLLISLQVGLVLPLKLLHYLLIFLHLLLSWFLPIPHQHFQGQQILTIFRFWALLLGISLSFLLHKSNKHQLLRKVWHPNKVMKSLFILLWLIHAVVVFLHSFQSPVRVIFSKILFPFIFASFSPYPKSFFLMLFKIFPRTIVNFTKMIYQIFSTQSCLLKLSSSIFCVTPKPYVFDFMAHTTQMILPLRIWFLSSYSQNSCASKQVFSAPQIQHFLPSFSKSSFLIFLYLFNWLFQIW